MSERVDQDRLADYVGGALEGTPDAAAVRTLIETDPDWAAAHADLVSAMDAVSADLRALGSRPPAVPEDVAARLDGFLRRLESDLEPAGAARTATGGPTAAGDSRAEGARSDASRGPGGSSRPGGAGPGRRTHSRRARWAAGLSAAAAVIAVGIGAIALVPAMTSQDSTTGGAADSAAGGAAAPQVATAGSPVVSGRDYAPGSFAGLGGGQRAGVQDVPQPPAADTPGENAADQSKTFSSAGGAAQVPPELSRLQGAGARQDCLDAIRQVHGGTPRVVEFARFTGRPALVVLLDGASTGNGQPWVVVAGPDCGLTPGDVDELYNGPLS